MSESYRIRTKVGVNQTINVELQQDFEFLEILSLKLQQADLYTRTCADYGVIVGRITANNGLGIPNARVSVFIPVDEEDEQNPLISSIYPYKTPEQRNEDGFPYNLLPYAGSYSSHAATGTFPTRNDVLIDEISSHIYEKYYRYSVKTNESGDYMIMGAPLGAQTIVMNVDLSDIGEFSLSPQDLIRMGLASSDQLSGGRFESSSDITTLPQIITVVKTIEVSPLWGDETLCQIAVNRVDFDLRNDANINIEPTATFIGSIFTSPDKVRVRPGARLFGIPIQGDSKPKDNLGNLCNLQPGPGQILAIRQTIFQDEDNKPILEEYRIEGSGNVIDEDGTWVVDLPMNLNYITTNEFGERVESYDPTIGVPTKSKYRFKIKWTQPNDLTLQSRRAYFLAPNIKEYGWVSANFDPTYYPSSNDMTEKQHSSYYFGLDWSGYTQGFEGDELDDRNNELINCEDTFYEFTYNKFYTISSLIDQWKKGGRARFIGIKEIDKDDCESTVNKFPVNEGFKNFDFLYFLFSIFFTFLQFIVIPILIVSHIVLFIYQVVIGLICAICGIKILGIKPFGFICNLLNIKCQSLTFTVKLPMITYPGCTSCACDSGEVQTNPVGSGGNGVLTFFSEPGSYYNDIQQILYENPGSTSIEDVDIKSLIISQAVAGNSNLINSINLFKTPKSDVVRFVSDNDRYFAFSYDLPVGERINIFNGRSSYFAQNNRIKVKFNKPFNSGVDKHHYDNTVMVLSNTRYNVGDLLTTVDTRTSNDVNFFYTAETQNGVVHGIDGTNNTVGGSISVRYATSQNSDTEVIYNLHTGTTIDRNVYPSDREYFQVITAITVGEIASIWNTDPAQGQTFPNAVTAPTDVIIAKHNAIINYSQNELITINPLDVFNNIENEYVLVLQRGVDPYSPKYINEYKLGRLFGYDIEDANFTITAETRLNIPIQKLSAGDSGLSVQRFEKQTMYYPSNFFIPGDGYSGFNSNTIGYYGELDAESSLPFFLQNPLPNFFVVNDEATNGLYDSTSSVTKYDNSEDLSGLGGMYIKDVSGNFSYDGVQTQYYSKILNNEVVVFDVGSKSNNVMRTDRLPSSDVLNGESFDLNPAILQQNTNFAFYLIPENEDAVPLPTFTTGADQVTVDIDGISNAAKVLSSFECENMVSLDCYEGTGDYFMINQDCVEKEKVISGCYIFLRRPLIDLVRDINTFSEWSYRYRFFYGLCRGILSQTFTNNWINGSLFAFPIQVNTFYDSNNNIISAYPKELIFFDSDTNNFYYRSSPYSEDLGRFVGKNPSFTLDNNDYGAVNKRNLLFPVTIMDLGMKNRFYEEVSLLPYTKSYTADKIDYSSYGDTSDLVNLFVISRITDTGFLGRLIPSGNDSINQLFRRNDIGGNDKRRVDGDLAQLMSINSEVGVFKFSPEYYEVPPCDVEWCENNSCKYFVTNNDSILITVDYENGGVPVTQNITPGVKIEIIADTSTSITITPSDSDYRIELIGCATNDSPTRVLGNEDNPVMAVWFSSNTEHLQLKDFLTPGKINFRPTDITQNYPFYFGVKSQVVPFYQWGISDDYPSANIVGIFGNRYNNWKTGDNDIFSNYYQSLDRMSTPYFQSTTSPNSDLYDRGYIFSTDSSGNYSIIQALSDKYLVGAPFHFYFGVVKGASAMDKFKRKYVIDE